MRWVMCVLGLFGFCVVGCGSSEADSEQTALEVVEGAYDAFNAGDVEEWVVIRDQGSYYETPEEQEEAAAYMMELVVPQVEGGARFENIECESLGEGEWPVADAGPVEGYYFTCDTTFVDSEGVESADAFEWVVADGEVVAVRSSGRF